MRKKMAEKRYKWRERAEDVREYEKHYVLINAAISQNNPKRFWLVYVHSATFYKPYTSIIVIVEQLVDLFWFSYKSIQARDDSLKYRFPVQF